MTISSLPAREPAAHNLFFALRPPEDICARIAEATASLPVGGKAVRPDRLHITTLMLVHRGTLSDGLGEEAAEVATAIRAAPFNVMFDRLVAGTKSIMLLPSEPLDALRMFRERLGFMVMRAGLDFRLDGQFNPHITLLYGNELTFETEIDPIVWKVEDFMLIDSHVGQTKHVELGRWPLRDH